MQINTEEFRKIVEYTRDQLLKQLLPAVYGNGYPAEMVPKATILSLPQLVTLDNYLAETGTKKERKKTVQTDEMFKAIWNEYPSSASFQYRGMKFTSSRVLRANYQVCELLYQKAVADKSVTGEQILAAIKKQVQMVKEESYESGQNRMQYMSALEVFLRQRKYEAFVGMEVEEDADNFSSNCA